MDDSTSFRKYISGWQLSQLISIRSISSWWLFHLFQSKNIFQGDYFLKSLHFSQPKNHMIDSQMLWECPSVTIRTFVLLSKILTTHIAAPVFCLGYPLNLYVPPSFLFQDCPPEAGDFRAQQCSAHNDVKHHGQFYEWLPVSNDPDNPCSLKCQAKGTTLVVELAPKVLDGTRCYTESLDMCISGLCQVSADFFPFYFSRGS